MTVNGGLNLGLGLPWGNPTCSQGIPHQAGPPPPVRGSVLSLCIWRCGAREGGGVM